MSALAKRSIIKTPAQHWMRSRPKNSGIAADCWCDEKLEKIWRRCGNEATVKRSSQTSPTKKVFQKIWRIRL
jgi:hypothetical protein